MADEMQYDDPNVTTGLVIYVVERNGPQGWNVTGSAYETYSTTRSNYWRRLPEIGSTGSYGPLSLLGNGSNRWWQIYLQASGSNAAASSHANDSRLATGYEGGTLTQQQVRDAMKLAPTVGSVAAESIDDKLSDVAGTLTDVDLEPVPTSRTILLIDVEGEALVGQFPKTVHVGSDLTFAWDFRNDLNTNGRIRTVDQIEILSGTDDGFAFGTPGRSATQGKVQMQAITAGDYTVRMTVTYDNGDTQKGDAAFHVVA